MAKKQLGDVLLVIGIAIFIVALPTVYGWYLNSRDLMRKHSIRSGQA
jgi:hypothetical protein